MTKEVPLQAELFTGDLVDTRTRRQKQRARDQQQPRQIEMFSQRELAQFGVRAHPKLPISPKTRIELAIEDRRTCQASEASRWKSFLSTTYARQAKTSNQRIHRYIDRLTAELALA
jgi:hypothetical protein